ncbi:hypothetical protein ACLI4Z_04240 [Natrialbaceae archaeon A-arb3/5]
MWSSLGERVRLPRVALVANLALVMTGSVLGLLSIVDFTTGVIIVVAGLVGAGASMIGLQSG